MGWETYEGIKENNSVQKELLFQLTGYILGVARVRNHGVRAAVEDSFHFEMSANRRSGKCLAGRVRTAL